MGAATGTAAWGTHRPRNWLCLARTQTPANDRHNPFDFKVLASIWTLRELGLFGANYRRRDAEYPEKIVKRLRGSSRRAVASGVAGAAERSAQP